MRWIQILVLGTLMQSASLQAQPQDALPADVISSLTRRLDSGENVGIMIGVVDETGSRTFGFGRVAMSSSAIPDQNTLFEIGGLTQVFTGLILADMVQRGEVALDASIETLLPNEVQTPRQGDRSITLLDLATHRSSLPPRPDLPANAKRPFDDFEEQDIYGFLGRYVLRRPIGVEFEHSDFGMGLLGHLLVLTSDMSYEALVVERIADPLGMTDTRIVLRPEQQRRFATGFSNATEAPAWQYSMLLGAGALRSTTRDLLVLLGAELGFIDSPLVAAVATTQAPRGEGETINSQTGLGWQIRLGDPQIYHARGSTGGYTGFIGFLPGSYGVVVLTNTDRDCDDIGMHLLDPSLPLRQ